VAQTPPTSGWWQWWQHHLPSNSWQTHTLVSWLCLLTYTLVCTFVLADIFGMYLGSICDWDSGERAVRQ
jgi:hypothetical protein